MARAYLAGTHSGTTTRTWRDAIEANMTARTGANRERWKTFLHDQALGELLPLVIVETDAGSVRTTQPFGRSSLD